MVPEVIPSSKKSFLQSNLERYCAEFGCQSENYEMTEEKHFLVMVHPSMVKALELTPKEKYKIKRHTERYNKRYGKDPLNVKPEFGLIESVRVMKCQTMSKI